MTKLPLFYRFLIMIGLIVSLSLLAACGAEAETEPTPILPPPNVNVSDGGVAGGTTVAPTLAPGQVISGTAVPGVEIRPQPTPTLTATAIPMITPVTNPPVQAVTGGSLPPASRDLLFIADGAFKRWNHRSGQIDILLPGPVPADRVRENTSHWNPVVGDVTDFSVSADGKRAAIARLTASEVVTRTNPVDNTQHAIVGPQHELWFMDLVSGEGWRIVPRVDNLRSVALSPDGQHVGFVGASLNGNYGVDAAGQPIYHVYFLATGGGSPGPVVDVAACQTFCRELAWHPDNTLLAWNDQAAVWLRNLAGKEPEKLLLNRPFDPAVSSSDEATVYSPIAWAGNGRYLLLWKGVWEGGNRAVFDVPTRTVVDVPDTFVYVNEFPTEVMWMPDHRLFVLRSETGSGTFQPRAELWRFQPEQNSVIMEESVLLSAENVGAAGQQYLEDGRFAYVLFAQDALVPAAGAYHLTSFNETPERVNASPPLPFVPGAASAAWSRDGYGVIMVSSFDTHVYYGVADGDYLYDLTAVLGAEPHAYHWQPEIVVP